MLKRSLSGSDLVKVGCKRNEMSPYQREGTRNGLA